MHVKLAAVGSEKSQLEELRRCLDKTFVLEEVSFRPFDGQWIFECKCTSSPVQHAVELKALIEADLGVPFKDHRCKQRQHVAGRDLFCFVMRYKCNMSLTAIASLLGAASHATIHHCLKRFRAYNLWELELPEALKRAKLQYLHQERFKKERQVDR